MFCGTVFGVESANIVGYASAELQEYGLTAGACFIPVSEQKFDLLDLKVTGFEEYTEADVYVQTLDEYGRTVNTYYYYDIPGELTGWLDGDDNEVARGDVEFQAGEGLWMFCNADGFGIQSAGTVPQTGVAVELQQYGLSVANPTPVNVDLNDITITGFEEYTEADVYVQTLDEYGRTVNTYYYYDIPGELTGWLDGDDNEVERGNVVLKPGEGLWSFCNADGFYLNFPGVDL